MPDRESVIENSSAKWGRSSSEVSTVMTNVEDERITPSKVSVQRVKRTSLAQIDTIRDVNEIQDADGKPMSCNNTDDNISAAQRHRVSVVRVNRMSGTDQIDKNNSSLISQEAVSLSSTPSTKNVQVRFTQVPKNQRITKQRSRAVSAGNVSVIRVHESSMEMQTLGNRSAMSMVITNTKAKSGSGVTVKKIPRRQTVSQSKIS